MGDQKRFGSLKSSGDAHPEWTLMYRKGLSRKKIAELARVKVAAVTTHLTAAKATDPGLKTEHRAAAAAGTSPAAPGIKRLYQLLTMVEATGRYPSRNAGDKAERELAQWLRRRRRDADAGILNPVIGAGLSVLPDWRRKPREAREDQQWQDRLEQLAAYLATGHPWPRTTPGVAGVEKELGGWLRSQRYKFRHGDLSPERSDALDAALPGWLTGRKGAAEPSSDVD
ncbi:helicase associated domain-containing protein [Arthrobacter sp. NPDC056493]|uniref:helicase associated domain-containing protein n=1 Tax=Arthrobacter sp. NPDC056493 TaxID=3345839 RepID=UPI00367111B7